MKRFCVGLLLIVFMSGCSFFGTSDNSSSDSGGSLQSNAQNRAAESNLRNAYTNAKAIYSDAQDWGTVTIAALSAAEPSLTFISGASNSPKEISVHSTTKDGIVLAVKSDSGACFDIEEQADVGGASYGKGSCDSSDITAVTFSDDPAVGGW